MYENGGDGGEKEAGSQKTIISGDISPKGEEMVDSVNLDKSSNTPISSLEEEKRTFGIGSFHLVIPRERRR